jgi:hypothetical protein
MLANKVAIKAYRELGSKVCGILDTLVTSNLENIAVRERADWVHKQVWA